MKYKYYGLLLIFIALLALVGCAALFPYDTVSPDDSSIASSEPLPSAPVGPARSNLYGLAWTPVDTVNPYTEVNALNIDVYSLVYEGLFAVGADFEAVPKLCGQWVTNDDRTEFTVTLTDAVFHNGAAVTAADVLYSLQQAQGKSSRWAARLAVINSAEAVDAQTVRLTTKTSSPRLATLLDFAIIPDGSLNGGGDPPGTGAYSLRRNEEGVSLQAADSTMTVTHFELVDAVDYDELKRGLESGVIQMLRLNPAEPVLYAVGGSYDSYAFDTTVLHFISFNCNKGLLQNALMRRWLASVPNRMVAAGPLAASAALLPVPPSAALYQSNAATLAAATMEQQGQWLNELNISDNDNDGFLEYNGKRVTFDLLVNADEADKVAAAQRLAAAWESYGVTVTVTALPWGDIEAAIAQGDFDMVYARARLTPDFSLAPFVAADGALNLGGYDGGEAFANGSQSNAATLQAFVEQCPIAPLWFEQETLLVKGLAFANAQPCYEALFQSFATWGILEH